MTGLTRRGLLALGGGAAAGAALGASRAIGETTLTAAPGAEVGAALGRRVTRVDLDPPDGRRVRRRLRTSRAGLDGALDGAHVYRVTRRDDDADAPGTLRHALTAARVNNPGHPSHGRRSSGPRIVVFDVGGLFVTTSILRCTRPRTWVAGQTAPSPVTLHGFAVSVQAGDVVLQHLANVLRRPETPEEAETARCFTVYAGDATVSSVWIDHCTGLGASDEAATVWAGDAHRADDVVFSHCVFGMPQRAAAGDDPFPYHEASHAFGVIAGPFTACALVECGIFGMEARSPQVSRGASALFANFYAHDYFNWANSGGGFGPAVVAPLLLSGSIWEGYDARLERTVAPADRGADIVCVGSYAEPGWFTYRGLGREKRISGRVVALDTRGGPHNLFEEGNRIEAGPPVHDGRLGPDGAARPHPPGPGLVLWSTPPVWCDTLPTHASAIRERVLRHAGAWAASREPMVAAYLGRVRAQAAKRWEAGEREPLFLQNAAPPTPAPGFAEGRWSPPPEPFAAAPDGLTAIEHALHALSVERGGAAFGNLGRPLHAPGGGLLTVAPDGAVLWRPGGRDGGAVEATVTFADGGRTRLVLGAA